MLHDHYNGIKYNYIFSKDADGYSIIKINEEETDRENGCIFSIAIDRYNIGKILTEAWNLVYFDNVVFEGIDADIYNNATVYRFKHFLYCPDSTTSDLFIVLNQVKYRLDWNQLGIDRITVPIGVIIPQNEDVVPIPTREDFYYTDEAIALVKKHINLAILEIKNLYAQQVKEPLEIKEFLRYEEGVLKLKKHGINLNSYKEFGKLPSIKLKGLEWYIKTDNYKYELLYPFKVMFNLGGQKATKTYRKAYDCLGDTNLFLSVKNKSVSTKNTHIRQKLGIAYLFYTRKIKLWGSYTYAKDGYYHILSLKKFPRSEWRKKIIEYQKLIDYVTTTYFYDYDSITPVKVKSSRKDYNLIGRVFVDRGKTEKYYDFLPTFSKKKIIFHSDRNLLSQYYPLYQHNNHVLIHVSKKNEEMLKKIEDRTIVSLEDEMALRRVYGKGVMKILFHELASEFSILTDKYYLRFLEPLNKEVCDDIAYAQAYLAGFHHRKDSFTHSLIELALKEKKYDHEAMVVYKRLKKMLPYYSQAKYINFDASYYSTIEKNEKEIRTFEKVLRYDQIKDKKRLLHYNKTTI